MPEAVLGGDTTSYYQVSGGLILGDTILIAERSTGLLRLFSRSGDLLTVSGGKGTGPGEFSFLLWVQARDSEIYAYDPMLRRLSVFGHDLTFHRAISVLPRDGYRSTLALGVFEDGQVVLGAHPRRDVVQQPRVVRLPQVIFVADSDATNPDSLFTMRELDMFIAPFGRRGEAITPLIFGHRDGIAVAGDVIVMTEGDSAEVRAYDTQGLQLWGKRVLDGASPHLVTDADIETARAEFVGTDSRPALEALFDAMPLPRQFPAFGASGSGSPRTIAAHSDGSIWVLQFIANGSIPPTYSVLDRDGTILGQLRCSSPIEVLDSENGTVLAVVKSEAGEEKVALFTLPMRLRPVAGERK